MAMLGVPLLSPDQISTSIGFQPRWNVSPSAVMSTVVAKSMTDNAALSSTAMRWGLEAPWSEPGKTTRRLINARSETLLSKPTFRDLAKQHRTVVPVNGFYEWRIDGELRIPYFVQVQKLPAMLLAAVYQPMSADDIAREQLTARAKAEAKAQASPQMGFSFDDAPLLAEQAQREAVTTQASNKAAETDNQQSDFTGNFAVVTTAATNNMAEIHHRAPVMMNVEQAMRWLYTQDPAEIESITAPESVMDVSVRRVSQAVNSSRNDGPECISPVDET